MEICLPSVGLLCLGCLEWGLILSLLCACIVPLCLRLVLFPSLLPFSVWPPVYNEPCNVCSASLCVIFRVSGCYLEQSELRNFLLLHLSTFAHFLIVFSFLLKC